MRFPIIIPCIAGIVILIDQITKLVVTKFMELHESIPVIPDLFNLCLVHNDGAAWGMLSGQRFLLILLPLIVCLFLWFSRKDIMKGTTLEKVFIGLFLGGMFGNLIDRVFLGYVVDFLDFYWENNHFPAFNIADSAICISVFVYILNCIINSKKDKNIRQCEK
ncbi:MAG: signal peptidase II [Kiritimatiellae bacterium]|nr:signal peptidase II [Kiritimatiellia bacterium]